MSRTRQNPTEVQALNYPCLECRVGEQEWCQLGAGPRGARVAANAGQPAAFLHSLRIATLRMAQRGSSYIPPAQRPRIAALLAAQGEAVPIWRSRCAECERSLRYFGYGGNGAWAHLEGPIPSGHAPDPEIRFAIDATCPSCKHPEMGYAPSREVFVCSRCGHTQTDRPES